MLLGNKRRIEVATSGIDEALQGLTSDPIGRALPQVSGLRVPPVLPGYTTARMQPRYLFCLATRTIAAGQATRIRGVRQSISIGVDANFGTPPERVIEMPVTSPFWHFPDGNVSWHLVTETSGRRVTKTPTTNAPGWSFLETDGSAMLYKNATFAAGTFDPQTGAPSFYNVGLTTYSPPPIADDWSPIGGYGNVHDLRFSPWNGSWWGSVDEIVAGTARISLYASILQSNPATRVNLTPPTNWLNPGGTPEEAFVANWTQTGEGPNQGPTYWRIAGAIIFDDSMVSGITNVNATVLP